ncbi:MAG: hypothetical protein A2Y67_04380 [Candidatus Buchananbacteria bacterium RBG_13_39_9]|uniref:Uncharacterized protein n=1 Tax=Candidatus Buchananbacteria bacterium RBG_13_39_9 TaxID=1797531 RepID=A0A1G1XQL1_9BACT|nr:MAG: hypothetical protein A2Y67_04380 [Candidatus Buchananbacteria bacterium RBG_13_39_9]
MINTIMPARGGKKILKIIIIILALAIIALAVNISGFWTFLNWPLNKLIAGTPDGSCYVSSDCKIAPTTCGVCDCGQAVNKNWQAYCPFKNRQIIHCKMCPSVQARCLNYACRTEKVIPSQPNPNANLNIQPQVAVTNADLAAQLKSKADLTETAPVEIPLPASIKAGQIQKYFIFGDLYLALVLQPSMNVLLPDVPVNYTAPWVGVLAARKNDTTWTQILRLSDQVQTDKNNPYYLWLKGNKIFLSVVDQNGAGSGEGMMKVLTLDNQNHWVLDGCYYFNGTYTDGDYFIFSQYLDKAEPRPLSECSNLRWE